MLAVKFVWKCLREKAVFKVASKCNRVACLSHPKALELSSIIVKKRSCDVCFDSLCGTHIHKNRVRAHTAFAQTVLVSISYEQLAETHDAHVSRGGGTKTGFGTESFFCITHNIRKRQHRKKTRQFSFINFKRLKHEFLF